MQVYIKEFDVEMQIRTKGIELGVWDAKSKHVGDLIITKTGLTWCKGKTIRENGIHLSWNTFAELMQSNK